MKIVFEPREAMTANAVRRSNGSVETSEDRDYKPASPRKLFLLGLLAVLGVAVLLALGIWQLERRVWKLDLIARVNQRVHAAPVSAPGPQSWPFINAAADAYRHVRVTGHFLEGHDILVRAVTELGGGYWVVTPFQSAEEFVVLVNRGFVPAERSGWNLADGIGRETTLTGLLRITEPGGAFLRHNDPATTSWYSRDVAAIASAQGLHDAAPYFIDADAAVNAPGAPVGGLTVIAFPNNHLLYALTWFSLAECWSDGHSLPGGRNGNRAIIARQRRGSIHSFAAKLPCSDCRISENRPNLDARSRTISIDRLTDMKNLLLLVQLRWLAVVGQVMTILIVHYGFGIALPLKDMSLVIAFLIGLNIVSLLRHHHYDSVSNTELFLALLLDVAALTMQLYLSGGAANPFVSLYLLQVTLGAVLLDAWSTWTLVIVTSGCFIWLTMFYRDIFASRTQDTDFANLHIQGMFICFVLSATLLVFFITRINRNLRARDAHLASLRQQSAEENHIVRMGLLASGAAHELGTPLSTLSVILNDWQHMPTLEATPELSQEIGEMQLQVDRCKAIVSGILLSSGEVRGEGTLRTTVNTFFDGLTAEWRANRSPARLDYRNAFGEDEAIVSDAALKQVIFNVFDNALEASPKLVRVDVGRFYGDLVVTVSDKGQGFSEEMLNAFGKPYKSSKGRPGGGLGLFLVVNVVRKLGGAVVARNAVGGGAIVTLSLPLASLSP